MDRKQVLIVEDDNSTRKLLNCLLQKHYNVSAHKDGFDGMAWLDFGNLPDVILMDINMPRFDGFDFLTNLRQSGFYRNIPVIALSGTDRLTEINRFFDMGGTDFIKKPFDPEILISTLNRHTA